MLIWLYQVPRDWKVNQVRIEGKTGRRNKCKLGLETGNSKRVGQLKGTAAERQWEGSNRNSVGKRRKTAAQDLNKPVGGQTKSSVGAKESDCR